jgi:flagellar biosynthesis protein FliR
VDLATVLDAEGLFAIFGPWMYAAGLVLTRIGALVMTTPVFSSPAVPGPVKMALVGSLTLLVMVSTGPIPAPGPLNAIGIAMAVISEAVVGGVMGLSILVVFGALAFCGQMVGIQMGFAMANVMDPNTFQQAGVLAQLLNLLALMLFLVLDGHLMLLRALFDSFQLVPLGGASPQVGAITNEIVQQGSFLFEIALRIALPTACVVLLVNVGLATIARTVPQVNVFVIGFMITISLGVLVLSLSLPGAASVFEEIIMAALQTVLRMVRYMTPA